MCIPFSPSVAFHLNSCPRDYHTQQNSEFLGCQYCSPRLSVFNCSDWIPVEVSIGAKHSINHFEINFFLTVSILREKWCFEKLLLAPVCGVNLPGIAALKGRRVGVGVEPLGNRGAVQWPGLIFRSLALTTLSSWCASRNRQRHLKGSSLYFYWMIQP